jgi:glycosyltransferase involved in cell wall biosynthesis/GT2 family glycosyltransferase
MKTQNASFIRLKTAVEPGRPAEPVVASVLRGFVQRINRCAFTNPKRENDVSASASSRNTCQPTAGCRNVVSIVTPFFNTGEVFGETAESVISQTFVNWEWVIVDDGSNDENARKILSDAVATILQSGGRVRVVRHVENEGLSAARNTGIKEAQGDFIMLLDSDDILEPTCLEKSYWYLLTHPECAFVGTYTIGFGAQDYRWEKGFHYNEEFLEGNLTVPNVMVRRGVALGVSGFDETWRHGLEDWDFWLRCANAGYWGSTIPEFLNRYRRRDTHTDRWEDFSDEGVKKFVREIKLRYPNLSKQTFPRPRHSEGEANEAVDISLPELASAQAATFREEETAEPAAKRLLLIVPQFEIGGADKWNLDLITFLKAEGWEVTVVATTKAKNVWEEQFRAVTNDVHILRNYVPLADAPRYLRWLIATRQPDVVCVSNSQLGYALLPFLRACFPEIPFVDYVHMEEEYWRSGGYAQDSVRHKNSLALTGVTSNHLKEWMTARGKDDVFVRTVYINIDSDQWRHDANAVPVQRGKYKVPEGFAVILFAGRLTEQKQPDVFAETAEILLTQTKDIFFLIVGDGKMAGCVTALQKKHPKNVKWLGAVESSEVKDLLNIADILFLPSRMEGVSLAFYEAMAMGVIPVGADIGGQAELVTQECGILLGKTPKAEQAKKYAELLSALLGDAERMSAMKVCSRERVEKHFQLRQMGAAMLAFFEEAKVTHGRLPLMPFEFAETYVGEIVEQFRLSELAEGLWAKQGEPSFTEQFRNSAISKKFSRTKRNILRFLMKHL